MAIKSSSIRPRDKNLKPQYIRSETRKTSKRGASSPLIVVYGFLTIIFIPRNQLYDWRFCVGPASESNRKVAPWQCF